MSLTKLQVQSKYPEVYESYTMQASLPEAKYDEKIKFWEINGINCFERWTIPYFLEREKEKKRPCLRLNYPPDGKCNDCNRGTCRYDKTCFMCGLEGHGAFQSFPGGKLKGSLKCSKHRNFIAQLGMIRLQHGIDEEGLRTLFKIPVYASTTALAAAAAAAAENSKKPVVPNNSTADIPIINNGASAVITEHKSYSATIMAADSISSNNSSPVGVPAYSTSPGSVRASAAVGDMNSNPIKIATAATPVVLSSSNNINSISTSNSWAGLSNLDMTTTTTTQYNIGGNLSSSSYDAVTATMFLQDDHSSGNSGGGLFGRSGSSLGSSFDNALQHLNLNGTNTAGSSLLSPLFQQQLNREQFQAYDVVDSDEYGATTTTLRVSLTHNLMKDDSNGSYLCKGSLLLANKNSSAPEDVSVRCWRRSNAVITAVGAVVSGTNNNSTAAADLLSLRQEIKALRILSNSCVYISKILHMGVVDMSSTAAAGGSATPTAAAMSILSSSSSSNTSTMDLVGIISEYSDIGTLDRYAALVFSNYQLQQQASSLSLTNNSSTNTIPGCGFSTSDLQNICVQLIESLMQCHKANIKHRDVRPHNIIVTQCHDKYQPRQLSRGLILKLANFTPISLLNFTEAGNNSNANNILSSIGGNNANSTASAEYDKWCAPEVDIDSRRSNAAATRYLACSDVWSLGLTLYYIASGGQLPFDTHKQACDAAIMPEYRRACLEKHGLQDHYPMLYDLIERLVRPAYLRTDLSIIRCHPFLWTMECRKQMLINFANASTLRNTEAVVNNFVTGIDKISPLYVFGADGWVAPMSPSLLALVQPAKLKTEFWWSGTYLLVAIKNQLQYPEPLLQSVYPRMTAAQACHAYLRQITDVDFPRLLILLYELGGIHGKWQWDGDEILHSWN